VAGFIPPVWGVAPGVIPGAASRREASAGYFSSEPALPMGDVQFLRCRLVQPSSRSHEAPQKRGMAFERGTRKEDLNQ
jgi:hypothetical protein